MNKLDEIAQLLVEQTQITKEWLETFLNMRPTMSVIRFIVSNSVMARDAWNLLADHRLASVRKAVAESPNCPLDVKQRLAQDRSKTVKIALAQTKRLTQPIVRQLLQDEDSDVVSHTVAEYEIPQDMLQSLLNRNDWLRFGQMMVVRDSTPTDILRLMLQKLERHDYDQSYDTAEADFLRQGVVQGLQKRGEEVSTTPPQPTVQPPAGEVPTPDEIDMGDSMQHEEIEPPGFWAEHLGTYLRVHLRHAGMTDIDTVDPESYEYKEAIGDAFRMWTDEVQAELLQDSGWRSQVNDYMRERYRVDSSDWWPFAAEVPVEEPPLPEPGTTDWDAIDWGPGESIESRIDRLLEQDVDDIDMGADKEVVIQRGAPYLCPLCGRSTGTAIEMRFHFDFAHPGRKLRIEEQEEPGPDDVDWGEVPAGVDGSEALPGDDDEGEHLAGLVFFDRPVPVKKLATTAEVDQYLQYCDLEDPEEFEMFVGGDPYDVYLDKYVVISAEEGEFGVDHDTPVGDVEPIGDAESAVDRARPVTGTVWKDETGQEFMDAGLFD